MEKKQKKPTLEEVISRTVMATRLSCAREPQDAFKATEKRLYAYPVLQAKIKDNEEMLEEIVRYKYFEQKNDDEIAELMHCAPRTVRAHKSRLVGRLSVFLYGAGALA